MLTFVINIINQLNIMRFKNMLKSIWHAFFSWFGQGLLYILPLGLTIFILVVIFQKLDTLFEFDVPGLGVLTLIGVITGVGFMGSFLISSPIFNYFGRLINRAPLVKMHQRLAFCFCGKQKEVYRTRFG